MKTKLIQIALFTLLFSCKNRDNADKLFQQLTSEQTHIDFVNNIKGGKLFNILYYLYYYNGAGVAIGDINNDGLPDIYFSSNNKAANKLYLNKGNFEFEDITQKAGVQGSSDWCTGVTMADVNGDGLLDIYVSAVSGKFGLQGHNELFINKGNLTFSEASDKYGLNFSGLTTQAAFFDYDHDGDLDCYVLNQSHHPHANIVDTSFRNKFDSLSGDRLYRNDINKVGKFTDVSAQAGIYQSSLGYGLGIAIADYNNDGWDDIYIGNDFHENDYYYLNQGNGTFKESGAQHFNHYSRFSMGNDAADYNNDGQMDIVTVDMLPDKEEVLKTYGSDENADTYKFKLTKNGYQDQYSKNCLQRNNGSGISFSETALLSGVAATDWSWAPLFADFDNDGNKDLFISSGIVKRPVDLDYIRYISDLDANKGRQTTDKYDDEAISRMPDGASHPYLFKGSGSDRFADVSDQWGLKDLNGYYTASAYADLDGDGKMDMVVTTANGRPLIFKNKSTAKSYAQIRLKGLDQNRFGIGAKVWLFYDHGKMQYQQVAATRGFQSGSDTYLHFGLNNSTIIDSVLVVWPSQKYQKLKNISAGKLLNLDEAQAKDVFDYNVMFPKGAPLLEEVNGLLTNQWKHQQNDFLDFNRQYLIPHELSNRTPKIAVGDIDNDGLNDFFVCGSINTVGTLFKQNKDGSYSNGIDSVIFNKYKDAQTVDAVFFDANNDGYQDLYVISGGNQLLDDNVNLRDYLFINDRKGHFHEDETAIPQLLKNKSCIVSADIDHDGDMDIFIGGLANAKAYGQPQNSYLLINDGKGKFSVANPSIVNLDALGMVTSAGLADINKDGWPDLIITGEWMPMKVFVNKKGKFEPFDIPNSTGLWQTVSASDIDGDGDVDILAGNWGLNTKLAAGKNGPLKLYVKDFDNNGTPEQIMCYTIDGQEYTFLAKDELERALPVLKKHYLYYKEVAGKTVQYMFDNLFAGCTELKAEMLTSACFVNDGKGGFKVKVLPDALQLSPLFSFCPIGDNRYLAGGNFYGVIPYEGRYDALYPTMFRFKDTGFVNLGILANIGGEVRDIKSIESSKNNFVIARNNNGLTFLKKN